LKTEILGWASSLVLLVTISKQIHKQWHEGSSKGVSKWLFIGQLAASIGFSVYSYLVHNWVFVVTNSLMAVSAMLGLLMVIRHRTSTTREASSEQASQ
jgi:MtN3 and saliva related transmembrane protein